MVFKLDQSAEHHWRRLNGHPILLQPLRGKVLVDGVMQDAA